MSLPYRTKLITGYYAFAIAVMFLAGTGLIHEWGRWYSNNLAYRQQTDAFLKGSLALKTKVVEEYRLNGVLVWDLVWTKEGVQQPWGLGVPIFRLGFDALAKLFGRPAFPDRIVFGVALMLLAYWIIRFFYLNPPEKEAASSSGKSIRAIMAVVVLILFPPFVALCRGRFLVYEEASAYAYLTAISLFLGAACFFRRPSTKWFLLLCLGAGLSPLVRPTLVFYSVTTVMVAVVQAWQLSLSKWRIIFGIMLFCTGGGLLFITNQIRFGSGFEFGHRLNLNQIDAMRFASRFDHPYRNEPLGSAGKELASLMFLSKRDFNGTDWYEQDFFRGQSNTLRWREMYFSTYDLSYAVLFILGGFLLIFSLRHKSPVGREHDTIASSKTSLCDIRQLPALMILWSLFPIIALTLFYLRCPFISSRYLLDFAPSFAVAILGVALLLNDKTKGLLKGQYGVTNYLLLSIVILWWGFQMLTQRPAFPSDRAHTYSELIARKQAMLSGPSIVLPDSGSYNVEMSMNEFNIPFNGQGWNTRTGSTKAAITLFVDGPQFLEFELAPAGAVTLSREDYEIIQAKVGLEFLELKEMEPTQEGMRLIFASPQRRVYQSGLQAVFVAFMTPEELHTGDSRFRLLSVRWKVGSEP